MELYGTKRHVKIGPNSSEKPDDPDLSKHVKVRADRLSIVGLSYSRRVLRHRRWQAAWTVPVRIGWRWISGSLAGSLSHRKVLDAATRRSSSQFHSMGVDNCSDSRDSDSHTHAYSLASGWASLVKTEGRAKMADVSDEACGSSLQAINEICAHRTGRQPLLTSFAEAGDLSALLVRHAPPLSEGNLNGPKDPQSAFPLKRHQFRLTQSPCRVDPVGLAYGP